MAEESFEDYGSGGDSSPFGNPAFRRSINRKSGRFRRPRPDKNSNLVVSNGNGNLSGTDATVESDIEDLTDAMGTMSRRIMRIEEERQAKQEHTEQVKIENTELKLRVNELDNNYHDLQLKFDEMKQTERSKAREDLEKLKKEKNLELELANQTISQQKDEISRITKENDKYRHKAEKYKKQLESLQDKLDAAHVKVEDQMEKYQKLNESTSNERERYTKQLSSHTTEKLQFQTHIAQLEAENKNLHTKYEEMKKQAVDAVTLVKNQDDAKPSEVQNLQDENDKLTQQIEDLNLQLLQQHISKAKDFQRSGEAEDSFANEIGLMEADELAIKYSELKCQHQQLQEYLDTLLTTILERDPSILEQQPNPYK